MHGAKSAERKDLVTEKPGLIARLRAKVSKASASTSEMQIARPATGQAGQAMLALSPLETRAVTIHVAGNMTVAEATRFMWVSKAIWRAMNPRAASRGLRWMRLEDLSAKLNELTWEPEKPKKSLFGKTEAPPRRPPTRDAEIGSVVMHFASDRLKDSPTPLRLETIPRLRQAIENDPVNIPLVRAGLREVMSLGFRLLPYTNKVAWLRLPNAAGVSVLLRIGQRAVGQLDEHERAQYDAVRAYVDEIASSPYLHVDDKLMLILEPERLFNDQMGNGVQLNLMHNPAFAASVVAGILEATPGPDQERLLSGLARAGKCWGELALDAAVNLAQCGFPARAWAQARIHRILEAVLRDAIVRCKVRSVPSRDIDGLAAPAEPVADGGLLAKALRACFGLPEDIMSLQSKLAVLVGNGRDDKSSLFALARAGNDPLVLPTLRTVIDETRFPDVARLALHAAIPRASGSAYPIGNRLGAFA